MSNIARSASCSAASWCTATRPLLAPEAPCPSATTRCSPSAIASSPLSHPKIQGTSSWLLGTRRRRRLTTSAMSWRPYRTLSGRRAFLTRECSTLMRRWPPSSAAPPRTARTGGCTSQMACYRRTRRSRSRATRLAFTTASMTLSTTQFLPWCGRTARIRCSPSTTSRAMAWRAGTTSHRSGADAQSRLSIKKRRRDELGTSAAETSSCNLWRRHGTLRGSSVSMRWSPGATRGTTASSLWRCIWKKAFRSWFTFATLLLQST
mmetsp:Transcript_11487/g.37771  ORF Transcript_11487/g.37771 Transcript_11487/m.37771 type:complete len:263 (+) Transcript_11487:727-1515(+)